MNKERFEKDKRILKTLIEEGSTLKAASRLGAATYSIYNAVGRLEKKANKKIGNDHLALKRCYEEHFENVEPPMPELPEGFFPTNEERLKHLNDPFYIRRAASHH